MLRGLWRLTWLEIKIFVREPLGLIGSVAVPVLVFVIIGRLLGPRTRASAPDLPRFVGADLPIFASILIAIGAVMSLVTILAIYREGGILKRLRATPLRPITILSAHVLVKLLFTAATLALMFLAGRRLYPIGPDVPVVSFAIALLYCTASIICLGFLIASVVPTARFAQPLSALIIYPMLGLSGLFVSVESLPHRGQLLARMLPLTYAVSLLRGVWHGETWSGHAGDVAVLTLMSTLLIVVASRVFRWE